MVIFKNFSYIAVKWEDFVMKGGGNTSGSRLLKLVTDNLMMQCVQLETRLREDDKLSRLNHQYLTQFSQKTWDWLKESVMSVF